MSIKPVYVETITEAKTYPAIVGRIVRCSPFVTVTDSGLSHWNFMLRGHVAFFISASGFNLPKRSTKACISPLFEVTRMCS